ncbi:Hpt domain-containing protein [Vibrio sp. qd031]|uniref:Hpt domain-containing protein n=1 Tax=Vibrio sp. qd031 TaxID=1603038 RepID=UPI000A0F48BD|nr:Hpt domain-containing protein [Vibrio sp. qd031]
MSSQSLPILDHTVLERIIEDTGREVLPLLFESYRAESSDWMNTINQAIVDKDTEQLEFGVHSLASTSLSLGVLALGHTARKIEHLCLAGKLDEAVTHHQHLVGLLHSSHQALEQFSNELGSDT